MYSICLIKAKWVKCRLSLLIWFFQCCIVLWNGNFFFRFYNAEENDKKSVISTSTISLFWSSLGFLALGLLLRNNLANWSDIKVEYITYTIWILTFDALAIIPFSKLRAERKPIKYALIKIGNVSISLTLTIFFLAILPKLAIQNPDSFFSTIYIENHQISYIFISFIAASFTTFLVLIPNYTKISWSFDKVLWKK